MSSLPSTTTTAIEALCARGIFAPVAAELANRAPRTLITAWCDYAERHPGMGTGALVEGIRSRREPPQSRGSIVEEQARYAERIVTWLRRHFPELDRPVWGPHPAAVVAVVHLHWRHGKGRLTKAEHGGEVRAAVRAWDERESEATPIPAGQSASEE